MKTLADILRESREEIERHGKVIDKLIAESKEAGVVWPEEEPKWAIVVGKNGPVYHRHELGSIGYIIKEYEWDCSFCVGDLIQIVPRGDIRLIDKPEVRTFNDVE